VKNRDQVFVPAAALFAIVRSFFACGAKRMAKLIVTDRRKQTIEVEARNGISIMENIRDIDNSVDAICGGLCSCATCHVFVDPAWVDKLPPRSGEEALLLGDLSCFDEHRSRLSCQLQMSSELDGLVLIVGAEEF
jgi:2Fe-2S ferredoxin